MRNTQDKSYCLDGFHTYEVYDPVDTEPTRTAYCWDCGRAVPDFKRLDTLVKCSVGAHRLTPMEGANPLTMCLPCYLRACAAGHVEPSADAVEASTWSQAALSSDYEAILGPYDGTWLSTTRLDRRTVGGSEFSDVVELFLEDVDAETGILRASSVFGSFVRFVPGGEVHLYKGVSLRESRLDLCSRTSVLWRRSSAARFMGHVHDTSYRLNVKPYDNDATHAQEWREIYRRPCLDSPEPVTHEVPRNFAASSIDGVRNASPDGSWTDWLKTKEKEER